MDHGETTSGDSFIPERSKTGRRFGVHENAKAIGWSKDDGVVLMASENITRRILFQERRGRPAQLSS
jgi:hypothetical protein